MNEAQDRKHHDPRKVLGAMGHCLGQYGRNEGSTYPIETRHSFLRPRTPGHKYDPSPNPNFGQRIRTGRWQVGPSPFVDNCDNFVRELFPTLARVRSWRPSLDGQAGVKHEDTIFGPANKISEIETASSVAPGTHRVGSLTHPCLGITNSGYSDLISA